MMTVVYLPDLSYPRSILPLNRKSQQGKHGYLGIADEETRVWGNKAVCLLSPSRSVAGLRRHPTLGTELFSLGDTPGLPGNGGLHWPRNPGLS